MVAQGRRALLGRIAEFGWFTQQGEPAATQALKMLLEDEPLKEAIVRELEDHTGVNLREVSYFVAEAVTEDGARPDLEGRNEKGQPLIVVEAKFGASLEQGQVRSYLAHQARHLGTTAQGVFVLLVPTSRVEEAKNVLSLAMQNDVSSVVASPTFILSWDHCIRLLEEAVAGLPDAADIKGDLVQFRAMCTTLGGLVIAPLGSVSFGDAWREREQDLRQLVQEVTEHFVTPDIRWPMSSEDGYEHRRYFPVRLPDGTVNSDASCSVGIATRFADEGQTPFWLRYRRQTPDFELVKAHLSRSSYSPTIRTDDRHLWLPLEARPDAAGPELVQNLVAQISRILATASGQDPAGLH